MHPCYLINWFTKTPLVEEPGDLKLVVQACFGTREMKDNKRVINTLCIIARGVLKQELEKNQVKDFASLYKSDSSFKAIFSLIFNS